MCKHQIANAMLIVSASLPLVGRIDSNLVYSAMVQTFPCTSYVRGLAYDHLGAYNWLQNTGQEFDGSDSGARPDEAVSWGKIRAGAESVKVGKSTPCLCSDTDPSALAGFCRRDACIPTARRGDIRSRNKSR